MYTKLFTLFALGAVAMPALAVSQVYTPTDTYRSVTTLLGVPQSPVAQTGWGDPWLTVGFSSSMTPGTVGVNWATWGSPPHTEQDNPRIWTTDCATSITFTFSDRLTLWGFEAEPNPFEDRVFTVDYYDGATYLGSITRTINGNAGARLLAAVADVGTAFTSVTVTSADDFAIAQLRYGMGSGPYVLVPEPASWAMLIAGFGIVGFAARRRRTAVSAQMG